MPHKTKRQKIASQMRRQSIEHAPSEESKPQKEDPSVTVFKHDFRKSLYTITLIITLEIIVYFGTMYYHPVK